MKIALVGKAGSGKSTVAKFFVERLGYRKLAFADAVKATAEFVFKRAMVKPKDRVLLQWLGDGCRQFDENVWINHLGLLLHGVESQYRKNQVFYNGLVIDDVRYPNEATFLKQNGFSIVKLVGRGYELSKEEALHPSERNVETIPADFEVDASGSVLQTVKTVLMCVTGHGKKETRKLIEMYTKKG